MCFCNREFVWQCEEREKKLNMKLLWTRVFHVLVAKFIGAIYSRFMQRIKRFNENNTQNIVIVQCLEFVPSNKAKILDDDFSWKLLVFIRGNSEIRW